MRPTFVSLLLVAVAFAGCSDGPAADAGEAPAGTPAVPGAPHASLADLPPGCDAARVAVVHGANGAPRQAESPGVPCLVTTPWGTGEPSLGLTSDGTLFLYPAFQAPSEQLEAAEQFTMLGIARSQDEGAHFDRLFSEVGGVVNFHPYTADPFMFVDTFTDRVFMEDLAVPPFNCANLSYSDDGGETWTQTLGGCMVWDHVGYASGPAVVSTPSWPVVIQRCAITLVATTLASFASGCQKSLDGGATWEAPGDPAFLFDQQGDPYAPGTCHGAVHHPAIDHRGWTWLARTWCDLTPWVAISKDEGATWQRYQIDTVPAPYHDVGIGVDPSGTAYAFYIAAENRPVLSVSHDDGVTWSDPIDIAPPGLTAAGMANIHVGGVGKAAFSYVATFDGLPGNHAVIVSGYGLDGPDPVFHSGVPTSGTDPLTNGGCSGGTCSGQADFLDATIGPDGTPWGSFTHHGKVAGGRLWGAPSLWDATDPNGTYRDL